MNVFRVFVFSSCLLCLVLNSCVQRKQNNELSIQKPDLILTKKAPIYCGTRFELVERAEELAVFQSYMETKFIFFEPNRSFVITDDIQSFQTRIAKFSSNLKGIKMKEIYARMKFSEYYEDIPNGKLYWCNTWDFKTDSLSVTEEYNLAFIVCQKGLLDTIRFDKF